MTVELFEKMGIDMCRTILVYENLYIPPELEHLYGKQEDGVKVDITNIFAKEILENKKLL